MMATGLLVSLCTMALPFDSCFHDRTLRLDYVLAGDAHHSSIYLERMSVHEGWAGRRRHLADLPLEGNGRLTMTDAVTGDTLYRHSFCTLFQEWQSTTEATLVSKSFQQTLLVPMPMRRVVVSLELNDTHRKVCATMRHEVSPDDILIVRNTAGTRYECRDMLRSGSPQECIDVVFLAEGYTAAEMETFFADARAATDALLAHEPFKGMASRFNIVAVGAVSADSGVSVPLHGAWRNTVVHSHFSTFYSDRYLTTPHVFALHDALEGVPYEHVIVLANTDTYGGGGIYNLYTLTTAHHDQFRPVVVHEFGHSFGGLADEYFYDSPYEPVYPADTEPWEQNITTRCDFGSKWADMITYGTPVPTPDAMGQKAPTRHVGLYEGGGYQTKGVWRGCWDCRMRTNEAQEFCAVCRRALERLIRFYTE